MNPMLVILVFTVFLIGVISSLDSTQALQYSNHTSHNVRVQFEYPTTWKIIHNESTQALSKLNTSKLNIRDPSSEDGGDGEILISSQALSVEHARYISDTGIRVMTELGLQVFDNGSSIEYNVIKYPHISLLTVTKQELSFTF